MLLVNVSRRSRAMPAVRLRELGHAVTPADAVARPGFKEQGKTKERYFWPEG